MNKKLLSILLITFFCYRNIFLGVDPFSKITITSQKAVCKKNQHEPKVFTFTYMQNVDVTFSDGSKINAEELEIELDATKITKKLDSKLTNTNENENTLSRKEESKENRSIDKTSKDDLKQFRKIIFKKNVCVQNTNRSVRSDLAEIFLQEKKCKLSGNVKIEQTKNNPKDLPILTQCDEALLDMQNEEITFLGTSTEPVNTVITIAGRPGILKKVKTRKERKAEERELKLVRKNIGKHGK